MASKLTEIEPLKQHQILEYIDRLLAFADEIEKSDPKSADFNRWVASNYRRNLSMFPM